jgi:hypothetical protein
MAQNLTDAEQRTAVALAVAAALEAAQKDSAAALAAKDAETAAALAAKDAQTAAALAAKDAQTTAALAAKDAQTAAALAAKDAQTAAALAAKNAEIVTLRVPAVVGPGLKRVHPTIPTLTLQSPTKGKGAEVLLRDPFTGFLGSPIALIVDTGVGDSFNGIMQACEKDPASLMDEKKFYDLAVKHLPPFAVLLDERAGSMRTFGERAQRTLRYKFASCHPELKVRGRGHTILSETEARVSRKSARVSAQSAATAAKADTSTSSSSQHSAASAAGSGPALSVELGPGYSGELKSVDTVMVGQALYYELMDITGIYFPASKDVPGERRFYARPPFGYSLLGFPHVAYYVVVELVGKAVVSPVSQPFFLGSAQHAAAAAALPSPPVGLPVRSFDSGLNWTAWGDTSESAPPADVLVDDITRSLASSASLTGDGRAGGQRAVSSSRTRRTGAAGNPVGTRGLPVVAAAPLLLAAGPAPVSVTASRQVSQETMREGGAGGSNPLSRSNVIRPAEHSVCWARDGGEFLKLVRGDARTAEQFRDMHVVYNRLCNVLQLADRPPELGATAKLLYGQHEVLVVMEFAEGVECTDAEVTEVDGVVMQGAARAIAWLALQGVVYTDLRGPNVLKRNTRGGSDCAGAAASPPAVTLIDFDDCYVAEAPVTSLAAYEAALRKYCDEQLSWLQRPLSRTFAEEFVEGGFPALRAVLTTAFDRLSISKKK